MRSIFYSSVSSLTTQQEIADAVKTLQDAEASIADPTTKVDQLLRPTVNVNRKGRNKVNQRSERQYKENGTLFGALESIELDEQLETKRQKTEKSSSSSTVKEEREASSSVWDRLLVYNSPKQQCIFDSIDLKPTAIKKIYDVGPDGNCDF
ncbi:hypothetical protein MUCCIDRAFT_104995 [Mucor lusitanicus CBS 277.49]|uniref:Uncharacterized protein n=1 Tax=Mucor lusitanicus CBS 277.49 TaxID=747725 RepID=A0A168PPV5_MUCCL|nr:hypothetical protein MUCCIDRAFT_104995 [Mucor lusitanicus CBS 277.49]